MIVGRSAVRAQQWWDYKIPPLVIGAVLIIGSSTRAAPWREVGTLILFLAAASGVAAFGHVVNDLADVRTDALAGKRNVMAMSGSGLRAVVLVATLAVGLVPFVWLPHRPFVLVLVAAELALLLAYSLPPLRLKNRATFGVLADATYAYVLPIGLTMAIFAHRRGAPRLAWWVIAPVLGWSMLMGVRGIVSHQVEDLENDRRGGVGTLAARIGADRAVRFSSLLATLELLVAGVTVGVLAVATRSVWLGAFAVAYLIWRIFQVWFLWDEGLLPSAIADPAARLRLIGFVILNEFVERWLPLAVLVALAIKRPGWWFVIAVYLLVFDNALVEFVSRDAKTLPDATERLAFERRARRLVKRAAAARRAISLAGPSAVSQEARRTRRWVFVVCGPTEHVLTLRTALHNLGPLTSLEIWVVTDTTRNEIPIDDPSIDHLVDVSTPPDFDNHQASIWLKTGLHRHLPEGEWCYLDSDVIAVAPGLEEIFDQRQGPIAFASDLTIAANQVDRFSPWAMTCDCAGHGEEHSCSHLRQQLQARFGLDVPGDWVHWNGGVFVFGHEAAPFLDLWHERAVASFDWPEWLTRDQGTLIATAWTLGLEQLPRLPSQFNFIADLGNGDLCYDLDRGWALHPSGPWIQPRFMHLYTSRLDDPDWDLGRDVETPVIRQSIVRSYRWRRSQRFTTAMQALRDWYWNTREKAIVRARRVGRLPQRLGPKRWAPAIRRRLHQGGPQ